jgi:pimeloyl-ACP methyl ester carboxylesterase
MALERPALEGSIAVRDGRRLGFAEYGRPHGRAVVWMHGTPGARRQIPLEARAYAEDADLRLIGIDRPGIGSSTAHLYDNVADWVDDLRLLLDILGISNTSVVGLSGGGPYALAAGALAPDRVSSVGVLGGVPPTVGPDAIRGGVLDLAVRVAPVLRRTRLPLSVALTLLIRGVRPLAGPGLDLYAFMQPKGDKQLLARPEFRAMFLDDLLHGARFQTLAPLNDLLLFAKDWGFALADVAVPVHWWHGDADHIIPFAHGRHCADRLRDVTFTPIDGESHLGGLAIAREVLGTVAGRAHDRATVRTVPD